MLIPGRNMGREASGAGEVYKKILGVRFLTESARAALGAGLLKLRDGGYRTPLVVSGSHISSGCHI